MFPRWCLGWLLGTAMAAGLPAPIQSGVWILALDNRGGVVGDLKPEELQVRVDGKLRAAVHLRTPAQMAEAPQSWVLVFEPIRDTPHRAVAFLAAADFLMNVPEGDRVCIIARGKDSLESLMPGFSARRGLWAEALAKIPDMLPESLIGSPKEMLQGAGFLASFSDAADGPAGQEALVGLLRRYRSGDTAWARGRMDMRGVRVIDRLKFDDRGFVTGSIATIEREFKTLETIFDLVAPVPGQKHLVVFSRCESDDMCHPSVRQAMTRPDRKPGGAGTQGFKRESGDMGGPAEAAALAFRDMSLLQERLQARAVTDGITLYSVAGSGQNILGLAGAVAPATGGFSFPLASGIETTFGQSIQVFGFRHLVEWTEDGTRKTPGSIEISTNRPGVKLLVQASR